MASSTTTTHDQLHHYATTAAPPPTPSSQPNPLSSTAAADTLSCLLLRLPPTLSLPKRRPSPPSTTTTPPTISLSDPTHILHNNLLSASQLGFFQLTQHSLPSQLAHSAESDSLQLLTLQQHQKNLHFPQNWPLGFDDDNDENRVNSFCFDSAISTESFPLNSLREFTSKMEKVGLEIVVALAGAVGFENPTQKDPTRICSLMWLTDGLAGNNKLYPYVVGLQYQIRQQKCTMVSDSGSVSVLPQVDSVLVTLGDIAQVWSNGKVKKVIGRPMPSLEEGHISMTLLVTLPLDSIVSPLVPKSINSDDDDEEINSEYDNKNEHIVKNSRLFNSFSFEDYAWRIYHERILLKDPLERYRAN